MVRSEGISRARFLAGAAAAGVTGSLLAGSGAEAATRTGNRRGLKYRSVSYEVTDGGTPATGWNATRMRGDMRAIKDGLHADSVSVFGDGVDRLKATSSEAAERGLHVWLQPRLADRPPREILEHLAETGRHAERLRRQGARVYLSVGCEFVLFVPGIVPGDNAVERIKNLTSGNYDPEKMMRRLSAFTAQAAKVGRSVFGGPMTYGAAEGDEVDWDLFDSGLLDVFESMDLYAALVYNFVAPDLPHRKDPRYDLDLAGYGIVKPIWKTPDAPTAHWRWEPKEASHALARHYGRRLP